MTFTPSVYRQPGTSAPAFDRSAETKAAEPPRPEAELLPPTSDRALLKALSAAITSADREIIGRRAELEKITARAETLEQALVEHMAEKPAPASGEAGRVAEALAASPAMVKGTDWRGKLAKADAAHEAATALWAGHKAALESALDIVATESSEALERLQTAIAQREAAEARFAADGSSILAAQFQKIIEELQGSLLQPMIALRRMASRHPGAGATLHLLRVDDSSKIQFVGAVEGGTGVRTAFPDPRNRLPWQEVVAQFRAALEAEGAE